MNVVVSLTLSLNLVVLEGSLETTRRVCLDFDSSGVALRQVCSFVNASRVRLKKEK